MSGKLLMDEEVEVRGGALKVSITKPSAHELG